MLKEFKPSAESHQEHVGYSWRMQDPRVLKPEETLVWWPRWREQSILKEINPEYALEGLMLKLKHQYFGYLMPRVNLLKKTLMLGKIEGRRGRG